MKRFLRYLLNIPTWKSILLACLGLPVAFIIYYLPTTYPHLTAQLQNNNLNSFWDFVVIILAILLLAGSAFVGLCGSWLCDKTFDLVPDAMLRIQWAQVKILAWRVKFFNYILKLFAFIQVSLYRSKLPLLQQFNFYPPQLNPHSTLPYLLFPISCILLN